MAAKKRAELDDNTVPATFKSVTRPHGQQADIPASQDASNTEGQQADPMITKSYRFRRSHARRIAIWAKNHDMTEQEVTRQGQILFIEQYDEQNGGR